MPIDPAGMLSDEAYIKGRLFFEIDDRVEAYERDMKERTRYTLRRYLHLFMPTFSRYTAQLTWEQRQAFRFLLNENGNVEAAIVSSGFSHQFVEDELVKLLTFMRANASDVRTEFGRLVEILNNEAGVQITVQQFLGPLYEAIRCDPPTRMLSQ